MDVGGCGGMEGGSESGWEMCIPVITFGTAGKQ